MPADQHVVWASHTDRQSTYVVRTESPILDPAWSITALGLEDLVLAYMEGTGVRGSGQPWAGGAPVIWLTWRQFRTQFLAVYGLVAAACVWLAVTGPALARLARRNDDVYDVLTSNDRLLFNGGIAVLAVAPAVLGIFWGAPLVARELETGTYRLAWNQSVTRGRWLAAKLGFSVLATAVAVGILTTAITWWAHPIDGASGSQHGSLASRLTPISFAMRGIVPVGYAVFALLLGTLIGLILRRSVPAMALTLAIYVFVQIAVPLWVRPHLVPPTTTLGGHLPGHPRRHQHRRLGHAHASPPTRAPATGS